MEFFGRRNRYDIFEFLEDLIAGDAMALIALGCIAALIVFFVAYQRITGKSFVKSRKERRNARRRRKHVLWEYRRDED